MAEWDILEELLVDDLFGVISNKGGHHFAMLEEKDKKSKLKRINVVDVSSDAVLINLDLYKQPSTLFKGEKGECRRCDYVLVTKFKTKSIILFIEIKSLKLSDDDVIEQFKGAECVMDYCSSTIYRFHDKRGFPDKFNKCYVCFYVAITDAYKLCSNT